MAISGVVIGTTVPGLQRLLDTRACGTARQLATDIQYVRTEAVARNRAVRLSFGERGRVVLRRPHRQRRAMRLRLERPGCMRSRRRRDQDRAPARRGRVNLQANVGSVLFDPLHGTSTPTGTLRVIGTQGRDVHHIVNVMGRVRSCTPQAAMPGYRAC